MKGTRQVQWLKQGWKFQRGDIPEAGHPDFDDRAWTPVRVPHDWAITGPFDRENDVHWTAIMEDGEKKQHAHTGRTGGLPHVGKAWYRLHINLPGDIAKDRVRIEFDGVMSHSQVYCNGKLAGTWPFGYASFAFDITDLVRPGDNLIAVSVDNKPLASRWYPGAGIFRHVRLIRMAPLHVAHWGTCITTPSIRKQTATVNIRTELENHTGKKTRIEVKTIILNPKGRTVGNALRTLSLAGQGNLEQKIRIAKPELWSLDSRKLYTARTLIRIQGKTIDSYETRFGIRSLAFDAKKGFFLNGQRVQLNGVCMHHDLGPLGSAIHPAALKRQLRILQEMGCNSIRTSHNPPTPELLDFADEMGFLIIDEAFDEWRAAKCENGYHTLFDEWAERDLQAMIRRDRNHPSVILWSLGNEIREQTDPKNGRKVTRFLHRIARDEDPTRPTTSGLNNSDDAIVNGVAEVLDVPGWNYKPHCYPLYRAEHPDWPMYGSETASCVSSRGEYYLPADDERGMRRPTLQCNSFDLSVAGWANTPDVEFRGLDENPSIMGEFVWTGFDYLGEPTPYGEEWPSRSSYFGIIDLCGIPKDRYYLYQSRWAPQKETLHLLPHWTWPGREGQSISVHCYSAWNAVELFVNGKSQGKHTKSAKNIQNRYRLVWNSVVYEPGELKAVAYDNQGIVVKETVVRTAGSPAKLALTPEISTTLQADGDDMAFIMVSVTDADGNLCPVANHPIAFKLEGPAEIAAVDNGDATSLESFQAHHRKAFNGKCMVYLRSIEGQNGRITLTAQAEGLAPASIVLTAQTAGAPA